MDLNRKASQGGGTTGSNSDTGPDPTTNPDWRSQLPPDARQRMLIQIMDTLKKHLPVPVPDGLNELQKIAVWFEEKIYSSSTSEPDYVQKVSLKMLSMETKMQPGMNPPLSIPLGRAMTAQQPCPNPGQSLAMTQARSQPAARQQQQPYLQGSSYKPRAVTGGPSGANIPLVSGPSMSNSNPMSVPGGPTGSLPADMYLNTHRREPLQQLTSENQMLYQKQLALHQKQQQQQQQQSLLQTSSTLAGESGMISASPTGKMQLHQLDSVQQQLVGQGGLFQQKQLVQQQQQQPQPTMQNPIVQQTNTMTGLQHKQLQMQKNQMQHSQMQQNQFLQNQMQQSQMLNRQQNQLLERGDAGNMNNMQRQMQMQRQPGLLQPEQPLEQQHLLFQFLSQQQQQMPQQQLQPQQQQLGMMQHREMQMPQQWIQVSPALLQMQKSNAIDPQRQQQQQFIPQQPQPQQQQRVLQDVASSPASMDSTAQTGHPEDFQEETYQRIKYLKDTYFNDLREIYQKLSMKLSQVGSMVLPNPRGGEQLEKMKNFKLVLERMLAVLQLSRPNIHIGLKDKLSLYEKQILNILQNNKKATQQQPQAKPMRRVKPRICQVCGTCAHKRRDQ